MDQQLDIWVINLARETSARVTVTEDVEFAPVWSPDGKGVAYVSEQSVYIRPFSTSRDSEPISVGNGMDPQWRGDDGKELFYLAPGGQMMSTTMTPGPPLVAGPPRPGRAVRRPFHQSQTPFADSCPPSAESGSGEIPNSVNT